MFVVYFILSIVLYLFYYKRYRDFLHPCGILLLVWFFTCSISVMPIDNIFAKWSPAMHLVCLISGLSVFLGSIVRFSIHRFRRRCFVKCVPKSYRNRLTNVLIVLIVFTIALIAFLYDWSHGSGHLTFFKSYGATSDIKKDIYGSHVSTAVHFIGCLLPIVSVCAFFMIMKYKGRFLILKSIIAFSILFVSVFVNVSRGDLIFYFTAFLFVYTRFYTITKKQIIISVLFILVVFIILALYRVSYKDSIIYHTTTNPYFSTVFSYIASCFANLNDLINTDVGYHWCGNMTLQPLWSLLGIKDQFEIIEIEQFDCFNARTYLYPFFHDFKYLGVIVFPFLIGNLLSSLYDFSFINTNFNICLAVIAKAFSVPFFANYFWGDLSFVFNICVAFFIAFFMDKVKLRIV